MQSESKDSDSSNVNLTIQRHFVGWQCRLREYALRNNNGRPTQGICPRVLSENLDELNSSVILLLIPKNPIESIFEFRFLAKKTNDPNERYKKAIQLLSSTFFQHIEDFDGVMTGLFPKDSLTATKILKGGKIFLDFDYQKQSFKIYCNVDELKNEEVGYQFTYWHNFLFNPKMSPESRVLIFRPDWSNSFANPEIT